MNIVDSSKSRIKVTPYQMHINDASPDKLEKNLGQGKKNGKG